MEEKEINILISGGTSSLGKAFLEYGQHQSRKIFIYNRHKQKIFSWTNRSHKSEKQNYDQNIEFDIYINFSNIYGREGEKMSDLFACNIGFPIELLMNIKKSQNFLFINSGTMLNELTNWYAFSKSILSENSLRKLVRKDIRYLNLRLQNFYGKYDSSETIFKSIYKSLLSKCSLEIKYPNVLREFIHVKDVVSAIDKIIENNRLLCSINEIQIGTGHSTELQQIVKIFAKKMKASYHHIVFNKNIEPELSLVNNTNLCEIKKLGWQLRYNIDEGIEDYISSLTTENSI